MTILACGYPVNHYRVEKALNWLTRDPEAVEHPDIYWRLGPLLKLKHFEEYVTRDIDYLERIISHHAEPNPNQILPIFLLKVLQLSGRAQDAPERIRQYLEIIIGQWSSDHGWRNLAETTSHALAVVSNFEFPSRPEIIKRSRDLIIVKAAPRGQYAIVWDGLTTSTAFVIMNLLDSPQFRSDLELLTLMGKGVNHLIESQHADGYWPPEPRMHKHDIPSPDYYTGVVVRGIIAYNSVKDPSFPIQLMWLRDQHLSAEHVSQQEQVTQAFSARVGELSHDFRRLTRLFWLISVLGAVSFAAALWAYRASIIQVGESWIPTIGGIGAVLIFCLGIIKTLADILNFRRDVTDLRKYVSDWFAKSRVAGDDGLDAANNE